MEDLSRTKTTTPKVSVVKEKVSVAKMCFYTSISYDKASTSSIANLAKEVLEEDYDDLNEEDLQDDDDNPNDEYIYQDEDGNACFKPTAIK